MIHFHDFQDDQTEETEPILVTIPSDISNPLGRQSAVVMGLKKFTDYQLRVLCFTSKGDGPFSSPVSVRTQEDGRLFVYITKL